MRYDQWFVLRLLVTREKLEVSMKDFLRYFLGPVACSLLTPIGNVYKSSKSDFYNMLGKEYQSGAKNQSNTS